ncbi:2-oxoglutarate-dependent dioxygenase htyE [Holothuria leucospilota]|uniref:2-oxoglutarate-dependent dioxygenase htyE n=1 Tax=Holothuria leucospilota TaxID=206669 RepID=A0A9Q1BRY6_HOLLE|nr:2-oxoglutarate-dependent dioxygenase htyE [Holothuria leucospilota]
MIRVISRLNPHRANKDLKEAFNYVPHEVEQINEELKKVPEVADMMEALHPFFDHGRALHQRVLEIMARGLKLDDPYFFVKRHQYFGYPKGAATVRSLFYPAFKIGEVKNDQVRCGEHSDYGGITLLFQDKKGGLEVC